ncbi:hypothetical protein GCM10010121_048320 [Streptomyces brasiliensis]|uniref:Mutator family transposase n=1 Tax=Streptomyces brasiliensis TaxID=1954 RepID=A0A917KV39_9ACTN|nr:hypothetical protein GCM10010121_048320 [Streptomyces brasiliensis]
MTVMAEDVEDARPAEVPADLLDDQLIGQLADRARAGRLRLTDEGGLLQQLTKKVLQPALEGEITDHLGHEKHGPAGARSGNSRTGVRSKTVLADVGPVEVGVPRDRPGAFEPQVVNKQQRRPSGIDEMALSLSARGMTHSDISAHLAEVYRAGVSKQTISTISCAEFVQFLEFDSAICRAVCSTNAIESVNTRLPGRPGPRALQAAALKSV